MNSSPIMNRRINFSARGSFFKNASRSSASMIKFLPSRGMLPIRAFGTSVSDSRWISTQVICASIKYALIWLAEILSPFSKIHFWARSNLENPTTIQWTFATCFRSGDSLFHLKDRCAKLIRISSSKRSFHRYPTCSPWQIELVATNATSDLESLI